MSRSILNLFLECSIVTTIVGAFVLTTSVIAHPQSLGSSPIPVNSSDRLAVPTNQSPPKFPIAQICIGKHAELLCSSQGGTADKVGPNVQVNPRNMFQSWTIKSTANGSAIPGNITVFSGNSMDPNAIGGKINFTELP